MLQDQRQQQRGAWAWTKKKKKQGSPQPPMLVAFSSSIRSPMGFERWVGNTWKQNRKRCYWLDKENNERKLNSNHKPTDKPGTYRPRTNLLTRAVLDVTREVKKSLGRVSVCCTIQHVLLSFTIITGPSKQVPLKLPTIAGCRPSWMKQNTAVVHRDPPRLWLPYWELKAPKRNLDG